MPKRRAIIAVAALLSAASGMCAFSNQTSSAENSSEVCPAPKVSVPRPADPAQWSAWVDHRIDDLQPLPQERKFDRIGWSRTILDAEKLAKEHGRPIFLFTHDGRINTGRC
jgi:hypothetical protein